MIKVDDGVIVFPVSAKGKRAAAQGVVQRVGGDHESHSAAAEYAKAQGKEAPVAYQIKATGATPLGAPKGAPMSFDVRRSMSFVDVRNSDERSNVACPGERRTAVFRYAPSLITRHDSISNVTSPIVRRV
jgi:hypothetical protein